MTRRLLALLLGGALTGSLAAGLWACENKAHSTPVAAATPVVAAPAAGPPPLNVTVQTLAPQRLSETLALIGTTLADHDVTFSAETPGRVERLAVELGDRIAEGDELARIDYAALDAQEDQARAAYQLTRKTLKRVESLRAEELASQQMLDEAASRATNARVGLKLAGIQVKKSKVRSTLSGIVARRFVEPGEYVNPGQPLVQIVDFSTIVVAAQAPESDAPRIRRDMPVRVVIDSLQRSFQGKVQVLIPASHPVSRTFEVRVKVPNLDHAILVGMVARVEITTDVHEDAVVVPMDVIVETDQGQAAFVVEDGCAVRRPVTLGPAQGDRLMVAAGLRVGDQVVVEGQRDLYDGQPVRVVLPGGAPPDVAPSALEAPETTATH